MQVVDPVLTTQHLQSGLRKHSVNHAATASDVVKVPSKKRKVSSSSSAQTSDVNPQCSNKV